MHYKPLESAVKYAVELYNTLYQHAADFTQKIGNSLMPSGLELAVAGVPNSFMSKRPIETIDKS